MGLVPLVRPGQHPEEGHGRSPELTSRCSGSELFQRPDNRGRVLSMAAQDLLAELTGEGFPFLRQDPHLGPVLDEILQMSSDHGLQTDLGILHTFRSILHLPEEGSKAVINDEKEELLFASKIVVEPGGTDACGRCHVPYTGMVVTLLGEDPARALKDLNQLPVVAFLPVYHRCLILSPSFERSIGKLPEVVWGGKEPGKLCTSGVDPVRSLQVTWKQFTKEVIKKKQFPMRRSFFQIFLASGMCVLFTLPVSACQDADQGLIMAVAPETHGAIALTGGLPSVPDLVMAQGLEGEGRDDVDAWWDSWTLADADGAQVRQELYPSVSARLYPLLTRRGVTELLTRNEESLRTAKRVGVILANGEIEAALEDALQLHDRAWSALEEGEGERALGLALQSADALREVSPQEVAAGLLEKARESFRRKEGSASYSEEELTRIRRLTSGAREALESGDYPRAIRRAYYACQLLGVDPR